MDFQTYSNKVTLMKTYIQNKWANTPLGIARKLDISQRTVLRMIQFLKNNGTKVEYSKRDKIYKIE
jgi:biotin operon repressor